MYWAKGYGVRFAGAATYNSTTHGTVVNVKERTLVVRTHAGALVEERKELCHPWTTPPLTLGDLRRLTSHLPDDTYLFVDGPYVTSVLGSTYSTWDQKDPNSGEVKKRHAIALSHTMSNCKLK